MRKQNIIQSSLSEVAEDLSEIKNLMKNNKKTEQEERTSIFMALKLPIETQGDLNELEEYLNDAQLENAVS